MELVKNRQIEPIYEFGRFRLETRSALLCCADAEYRLPPKVYNCLRILLENSGRVVAKDDLTQQLWPDTFVDDNGLTYTVSQLRKTLRELDSETSFVETVPRVGYRFSAPVLVTYDDLAEARPVEKPTLPSRSIERVTLEETSSEEVYIPDSSLGIGRVEPAAITGNVDKRRSWPYYAVAGLVSVLMMLSVALYVRQPSAVTSAQRIAVLPLATLGGDSIDETLSLGLTDALITQLGRSPDLIVRPLSTSSRAVAVNSDPLAAGRSLNVDVVVDWHYQVEGAQIRVNAKLLSVKDGDQIWSEVFDGDRTKLFAIQDAISNKIASSLLNNLRGIGNPSTDASNQRNPEAYQAYLRGRFHWNSRTKEGMLTARGFFEQAVALDPKFADAHIGLADVYLGLYDYGHLPAGDTIPKAKAAVFRAQQLSPELSKAYSTLASIEFLHNNDWAATERNFLKAIELSPNDATPRLRFGWMLSVIGRNEEGLRHLLAAEAIDPTSHVIQANIAENYIFSGRIQEAQQRIDTLKAGGTDFSIVYWHQGTIYFMQGRFDEAIAEYLRAYELDEETTEISDAVRAALEGGGKDAAYKLWRTALEKRYSKEYFPPSIIALVAAMAKDDANAIKWLQEAQKVRDPWILQVFSGPEFQFLRGQPAFDEIIRSLNMAA